MIWIFGLITGLAFDMPPWWWAAGFMLAVVDTADAHRLWSQAQKADRARREG